MNALPSFACIGGAALDRLYRAPKALVSGTSNPVDLAPVSFGGVARNVAENLARLGAPVSLLSVVGNDASGRSLAQDLDHLGVRHRLAVSSSYPTAEYVAVLAPSGDLAFGLAAMAAFDGFTPALIDEAWDMLSGAALVFADCNLPAPVLGHLIGRCRTSGLRLAIDTVSASKAGRLPEDLTGIAYLFTNSDEAAAILGTSLLAEDQGRALRDRGAEAAVITLGSEGALYSARHGSERMAAPPAKVIDVTGAGDALIAATLLRLGHGDTLRDALPVGLKAAALTTEVRGSIRPDLANHLLLSAAGRIDGSS